MRVSLRLRLASATLLITVAGLVRADSVPGAIGLAAAFGHDDSYVYRLPYGDAVSFAILQAWGSSLSHRGAEYFTVDFGMPEGTLVSSAREGTVVAIEDRFDISCWSDGCDRFANFVEIRHPDGTIGKYFHLQQGSVLVRPGQRVERGQAIARSGDTGYSTSPHLHFGVYRVDASGAAQSIAVRFAVRGGFIERPRAGARYINAADR
jgi:murein DD-endopeptidase MepM/ murein hydrolase activator NlpD